MVAALNGPSGRKKVLFDFPASASYKAVIGGLKSIVDPSISFMILQESDSLDNFLDDSVAAVVLSHVCFKTGRLLDIKSNTEKIHSFGALTVWDISFSVGMVTLSLSEFQVDFALGSGSRYLSGGPGAPGFIYVNEKLHGKINQPLRETSLCPQNFGLAGLVSDIPSVLAISAMEAGVDALLEIDFRVISQKSKTQTSLFLALMDQTFPKFGFELLSPRESDLRVGFVSYKHKEASKIVQALQSRDVVVGYLFPDIIRFGFSPLYVSFSDIWNLVRHLKQIMDLNEWDQPQFARDI